MKKFLSVMLIVLLALCVFVSCSDEEDDNDSTTSYFTLNGKSYSTLQDVVDAASSGKGTPISSSTNVIGLTGDYTGPGAIISNLSGYSINFGEYKFNFTTDIVIKQETKISIIGKLESSKSSVGIVLENSTVTIGGSSEIDSNIKITGATLDVNDSATLSVDYFEAYGSKVKFSTTGDTEIAKIYAPTGTNEIEVAGSGKFKIEKNEGSVSYDVINSGTSTEVKVPSADGTTQIKVTTGTISSYSNGVKKDDVDIIVATIGTAEYKTLKEAVDAAKESEVVLLCRSLTSADESLVFDKSGVVLDLNGKTLTLTSTVNIQVKSAVTIKNGDIEAKLPQASNSAIYGLEGAIITLEDVDITAKDDNNNMAYAVALLASGTEEAPVSLTIKGGTFDGYVGTNGKYRYQNITIEDGTFKGDVYFPGYGKYVIKDGEFNSLVEIKSGTLEISGGKFNNTDNASFTPNNNGSTMTGISLGAVAYKVTDNGTGYGPAPAITITGGTFAGSIGLASQAADGTLPTLNVSESVNAKTIIFAGKKKSLIKAIDAAKEGDTIKLFSDYESKDETLVFDKSGVVFDLNEKTLSLKRTGSTKNIQINSDVTIKNGTINATLTTDSNSAIYGLTGAKLTLEKVNITAKDGNNNMAYAVALLASGTAEDSPVSLTIDGGTFDGFVGTNGLYRYQNITIKDGTFNGDVYFPGYGKYVINGGEFNSLVEIKSGTLEITGGEFKNNDNDNISFIVNNNGTTMTGVSLGAVAYAGTIDGKGYGPTPEITINGGTFEGVIGLASQNENGTLPTVEYDNGFDGEVETTIFVGSKTALDYVIGNIKTSKIVLYKDITYTGKVSIPTGKTVDLDLNGHLLYSTDDVAITNAGTLTIRDNSTDKTGKVKAQEFCVGLLTGNATCTIESGNFTAIDNAVLGTNGKTGRGGNTIIINGGTFTGGITSSGYVACGIYAPNDDTWIINGGTFNITGGAGIVARAGVVTVNDGTFNCSGNTTGKVGDSRVVVPCSALVFDESANYPGLTENSKIVVNDGTFNTTNGVAAFTLVPNTATSRIEDNRNKG